MTGELKVTQSNPKKAGDNKSYVRVYKDGLLIAEEAINKRSPLNYLANVTKSKHLRSLERQLFMHGLTLTDVGIKHGGNL